MSSKRKITDSQGPNSEFCDFLQELADYEKNVNRNIHKYNAYRNAASTLSKHTTKIKSGQDARALKGIGEKIADKIDEFIKNGKLRKLEEIRKDDTNQSITLLTKISGIGPAAAHKFVQAGIKSIEDLRKNTDKLNHHQKIGLKYFEDFEKKIPREEMEALEQKIIEYCHQVDKKYVLTVCGSYRRGAKESGDIDILVTHPSYSSSDSKKNHLLKDIVMKLENVGFVQETLSLGDTKFMGVCRLQNDYPFRRIDIRVFPNDQYFCAILYFTGSDLFNKEMRSHALKNGFTLNEYCIQPIGLRGNPGEAIPVSCEQDIFEIIEYPYKKPHERNI